jgi:pilus assembly protein Flp/PilA
MESDSFTKPVLLLHAASGRRRRELEAIMSAHVKRFLKDESGTTAIEYGLIASGISVAIIPAVHAVGQKLVAVFTIVQNAL